MIEFGRLLSLADAAKIWGMDDSTIRRAIATGKLITGIDCQKYGKQWVIATDAMVRLYGHNDKAPTIPATWQWQQLDMTTAAGHPPAGALAVLYIEPAKPGDTPQYDIGQLLLDDRNKSSRKLWWHGTHGIQDPVKMRKHNPTIWWHLTNAYRDQ